MTSIYILGYGSLIWDLDDLAPKVAGNWLMGEGPRFSLEFSYISKKRKQSLVVGLDPRNGVPCPSHAILSIRHRLEDAVHDLAARERTILDNIGWVDSISGTRSARDDSVAETTLAWCKERNAAGAVWTDGASNFETLMKAPFSVERGIAYLKTLTGESISEAERYINEAPAATDTPLRKALARDEWWREITASAIRAAP